MTWNGKWHWFSVTALEGTGITQDTVSAIRHHILHYMRYYMQYWYILKSHYVKEMMNRPVSHIWLHSSDFTQHRPNLSLISTALGMINEPVLRLPVKPLFADFLIVRWHRQLWVDELNRRQDNNIHTLIVPMGKMSCDSSGGKSTDTEYRTE